MTAHADPLTQYEVTDSGCWRWLRYVSRISGYGALRKDCARHYAHRFFYEHHVGPIPADHDVHHRCGNRACVNPDHLELVHHCDHTRELDYDAVREIRRRAKAGERQKDIAAAFGISRSYVSQLKDGLARIGA